MTVPKGVRGYYPPPLDKPVPTHVSTEPLGPQVPIMSNSPDQWVAHAGMMLRVIVGSEVVGLSIPGQGDRDEMGICVEPAQYVIGFKQFKHYKFRTAELRQPTKDGVAPCSGPGDLDLTVYSLRRYLGLAVAGNPTVLVPLFVPDAAVLHINEFGRELRENRDMLLSRRMAASFSGYLHSQRRGLMGLRSGGTRNQGRQDLRDKYGFDTKFAAHMVRLGYQGVELLERGTVTLPMPDPQRTRLLELREGKRTKKWALDTAKRYEEKLEVLKESSRLPVEPDWPRINKWVIDVHQRFWGRQDADRARSYKDRVA